MAGARRYSMGLRDEQTAATRRRILEAAGPLFIECGYLGTTLAAVATAAGVSVQTIYNLVGGKPVLLKTVYDVTLAGDDEPVPMAQRPVFRAVLDAATGRDCLAAYAHMGRVINERILPLLTMVLAQAATGDPDLREFATKIETEHGTGTSRVATHVTERFGLRDGLDAAAAADILWALTAPEVTNRLVTSRGWSWDRYETWLATAIVDLLLGPE